MVCPCGEGEMKRVFDSFSTKEGRTNNQKKLGATEKRLDSGKWMKEETQKRKKRRSTRFKRKSVKRILAWQ